MRTVTIAGREWRALLLSPAGWIIASLFLLMSSVIFSVASFDEGRPASLRSVFEWGMWMFLLVCPAISMRAIAEERRQGTFELLMTSPVRESQIVMGKFIGALGFLIAMLIPTVVYVVVLERHGRPDYGELACGYLGLLLCGSAYLASGIFASTLSASQTVAFLLTMFFWVVLSAAAKLIPGYVHSPWSDAVFAADPDPRLHDFAIGLVDTSNIMYFVSITIVFLAASAKLLQVGRWR
jgi:ABC-2 type transport system permease protein